MSRVVALTGGVGGARLVDGLARVLGPDELTVVVNTGDDLRHLGLWICPDLDTVLYTLGDHANAETGWGVRDESFRVLDRVAALGGPAWFRLGDLDLATHLIRAEALARGERLTTVALSLGAALGVRHRVLPMCDAPRPTRIRTEVGTLDFQEWLVHRRATPPALAVELAPPPPPSPEVLAALDAADLVVIGPSNPYVSVLPILTLPGVWERAALAPVVGVSPILGGAAVKGPLAEMLRTLAGVEPSARAVAERYQGLLSTYFVHPGDAWSDPTVRVVEADVLLPDVPARVRLARAVLAAGGVSLP